MKRSAWLLWVVVIALGLAVLAGACSNKKSSSGNDTPVPTQGATEPIPTSSVDLNNPAVVAARADLLTKVDLDVSKLRVVSATATTWPDACLDVTYLGDQNEQCAQVVTPGYEVIFLEGSTSYKYHTDVAGTNVRFAGVNVGGTPNNIDVTP